MKTIEKIFRSNKSLIFEIIILTSIVLMILIILFNPMFFEKKVMVKSSNLYLHYPWRAHSLNPPNLSGRMNDTVYQDFPRKYLMYQSVKSGQLPLWNPYWLGGIPLAAEQNSGVFYPLNILYYLINPIYSFGWVGIILLLIASISMYILMKSYGISIWGSRIGAIAYSFSPLLISVLGFEGRLTVYAFFPLIIFLIRKWVQSKKIKYPILCGLTLGVQFLGDDFQYVLYLLIIIISYLSWVFFLELKSGKLKLRKHILAWFLIFGIGFTGGAIQILPSLESLTSTTREVPEGYYNWVPPTSLLTMVVPRFDGYGPREKKTTGIVESHFLGTPRTNSAGAMMYVGIIPLLLAFVSLMDKRIRKKFKNHIFLIVIFLLFLITIPISIKVLSKIPIFGSMYHYARFRFIIVFILCLFSGIGFDQFSKSNEIILNRAKFISRLLCIITILSLLFTLITILLMGRNPDAYLINSPFHFLFVFILLFLFNANLILYNKEKIRFSTFGFLILIFTAVDLISLSITSIPYSSQKELYPMTESIDFLKKHCDKSINRVMTVEWKGMNSTMVRGLTLPYDIVDTRGVGMMFSERWWSLLAFAEFGMEGIMKTNKLSPTAHTLRGNNFNSPVYDALAVKYFITPPDSFIIDASMKKVFSGDINIYENLDVMPRAYIVYNIHKANNREDVFNIMSEKDFDIYNEIVIEGYIREFKNMKKTFTVANIVEYNNNEVILDVETDLTGFLVLTDTYYPGWQARINGINAKIHSGNYALRVVEVPPGKHVVTFEYRPVSFIIGSILTIVIYFGFIVFIIFYLLRIKLIEKKYQNSINKKTIQTI